MTSLAQAIALRRTSIDTHELEIPDGWQQGRGAFGGLVLAMLLDAMIADEPSKDGARLPRTISGDLCAPALATKTSIRTGVLRQGKNQTNMTATLRQGDGDEVVATANAVFSGPRKIGPPPNLGDAGVPTPPRFEDIPALDMGGVAPVFTQHYEYRPVSPLPFSGAAAPVVECFIRERIALPRITHASLIARIDAPWPAIFPVEPQPRPVATVSFLAEILCDPSTLDPTVPSFYRARAVACAGGYFVELRELWHDGKPLAFNQQAFALIG